MEGVVYFQFVLGEKAHDFCNEKEYNLNSRPIIYYFAPTGS